MTKADSKIEKWKKWLQHDLWDEIIRLVVDKTVYLSIEEIIRSSKTLPVHNPIYYYLRYTYASTATSAIRRLIDTNKKSISLANLLLEIIGSPKLITRTDYTDITSMNDPDDVIQCERSRLNKEFTKMAGPGKYIDPRIVADDYCNINKDNPLVGKVITYVNRFIAHHSRKQQRLLESKNLLKYSDLNTCIDKIEKIYVKYYTLITGGGISILDQSQRNYIAGEIKSMFKVKWI